MRLNACPAVVCDVDNVTSLCVPSRHSAADAFLSKVAAIDDWKLPQGWMTVNGKDICPVADQAHALARAG